MGRLLSSWRETPKDRPVNYATNSLSRKSSLRLGTGLMYFSSRSVSAMCPASSLQAAQCGLIISQQVLVSHARRIAKTYPQRYRQQYVQAAERLRSPYWDWAADSNVPPASASPKLQVNFPNGESLQRRQVDNPLYTYRIPRQVLDGQLGPFDTANRPQTLRCPAPQNYPATANDLLSQRPYKQWVVSNRVVTIAPWRHCVNRA